MAIVRDTCGGNGNGNGGIDINVLAAALAGNQKAAA